MDVIHYEYATPVFNGLYSVGTTVSFCDQTGVIVTWQKSKVTCDACLAQTIR